MKTNKLTVFFVIAFLLNSFTVINKALAVDVIPTPVSVITQKTDFVIDSKVTINIQDNSMLMRQNASYLLGQLSTYAHIEANVVQNKRSLSNAINMIINSKLREEEYTLDISKSKVSIVAGSDKGIFYGIQTLLQLIPYDSKPNQATSKIIIPGVKIDDYPYFAYRGAMLDVCRHFFTVDEVKRFIDIIALHKINTFHWHLTEDQGWRIEIKKYPKLTEIGSVRAQTLSNHYRDKVHLYDGIPQSGFYTQEQIKDIVKYASERFITVIPEIDMPGHFVAAITAYPFLGCDENKQLKVAEKWGVFEDVLCLGKESSLEFVEDVLLEVMQLFPSKYIHIGGDECPTASWKKCPQCQQLMAREKIENVTSLQSYFTHKVEKFLQSHGREMIGWDEVLQGGVSKTATIMSWRGVKGGIEAAKMGNKVIMTPGTHCYIDKYQSMRTTFEPLAIGGYLPVSKVYEFDPLSGLSKDEQKNVLGLQANLWTEYIKDFNHVQYMLLPRLAALAEVGWSYGENNYEDFLSRLKLLTKRYDVLGYNYARHIFTDIDGKFIKADSLTVVGKAMPTKKIYQRVDTAKYNSMPKSVQQLFTNSSGIAIAFSTNSSAISAKWSVKRGKVYPNMPNVNSMGLDLYIKEGNTWQFAGAGVPEDLYSERTIISNMDTKTKECLLFLPTYDELTSLEIGVDKSSFIIPSPTPFKGKYVVYGSSVTQGASASRPGMSYLARMSRSTGLNFINLGLSGAGKMESSVIKMLADIECDAYIMDCVANPNPEEILARAPFAIRYLREKHPTTPIIFIQSIIREKGLYDQKMKVWNLKQNEVIAQIVKDLQKEIPYLYMIEENDFLGTDHEGSIDGAHPNDLGFDRMIKVIQPALLTILNKK